MLIHAQRQGLGEINLYWYRESRKLLESNVLNKGGVCLGLVYIFLYMQVNRVCQDLLSFVVLLHNESASNHNSPLFSLCFNNVCTCLSNVASSSSWVSSFFLSRRMGTFFWIPLCVCVCVMMCACAWYRSLAITSIAWCYITHIPQVLYLLPNKEVIQHNKKVKRSLASMYSYTTFLDKCPWKVYRIRKYF